MGFNAKYLVFKMKNITLMYGAILKGSELKATGDK